jgi:hypothetical protein
MKCFPKDGALRGGEREEGRKEGKLKGRKEGKLKGRKEGKKFRRW